MSRSCPTKNEWSTLRGDVEPMMRTAGPSAAAAFAGTAESASAKLALPAASAKIGGAAADAPRIVNARSTRKDHVAERHICVGARRQSGGSQAPRRRGLITLRTLGRLMSHDQHRRI
jgi:hypothetical protein